MSYSGSLDVEIRSWSAAGLEKPSVARLEPAGHRYGSWLGGWTLGRRADIRVSSMGKIVLGHFPEYIALATEIGAELFNMPQDEWDRLDDAGRWEANRKFLDEAIDRDEEIVL